TAGNLTNNKKEIHDQIRIFSDKYKKTYEKNQSKDNNLTVGEKFLYRSPIQQNQKMGPKWSKVGKIVTIGNKSYEIDIEGKTFWTNEKYIRKLVNFSCEGRNVGQQQDKLICLSN
ncbi:hypothetical protein COBT_002703, partial [Conglomerata obtusa]